MLRSMNSHVSLQISFRRERSLTDLTLERTLTCKWCGVRNVAYSIFDSEAISNGRTGVRAVVHL